jgi:hypothetical protein
MSSERYKASAEVLAPIASELRSRYRGSINQQFNGQIIVYQSGRAVMFIKYDCGNGVVHVLTDTNKKFALSDPDSIDNIIEHAISELQQAGHN